MKSGWLFVGAVIGGLGVILGAFTAHGLKLALSESQLAIFEVGVRYQMYHALALLAVAWVTDRAPNKWAATAGYLFMLGVVLFSGSLYLLAISGERWLGIVTPIGGLCLILGWMALAVGAMKNR